MNSNIKRRRLIKNIVSYAIMAIVSLAGLIVCITWVMGYRFDIESGKFSQVALLQFNTFPEGATIWAGKAQISATTPTRSNVSSGTLEVSMLKDGYHVWKKTVNTLPSTVRWLDYARLVPKNVKTDSIKSFRAISQVLPSPNRNFIALKIDNQEPALTIANISNPKNVKFNTFDFTSDVITTSPKPELDNYQVVEWDAGSRFLLVKHTFKDQDDKLVNEYLRLDRDNNKLIKNISRDLGLVFNSQANDSEMHFIGGGGNLMYGLINGNLRKLDYGSLTVTAPIATNVLSYSIYGTDRVALVRKSAKGNKNKLDVVIYYGDKLHVIKSYDDSADIKIGLSKYNGVNYLAIARGENVSIYPNPLDDLPTDNKDLAHGVSSGQATRPVYLSVGPVDYIKFSPNGRFLLSKKGNLVSSFDTETSENYSFNIKKTVNDLVWLDDYNLVDIDDNGVSMMEFDGNNRRHIVSGAMSAGLSANYKYFFSIDNVAGGVMLQRSTMTAN